MAPFASMLLWMSGIEKAPFFWKSMDFQLSLEKKIKSEAILVNFLERFEVTHKMEFSSSFFRKSQNPTKHHFFSMF